MTSRYYVFPCVELLEQSGATVEGSPALEVCGLCVNCAKKGAASSMHLKRMEQMRLKSSERLPGK